MAEDRLTILYNWSEEMTKAGEAVKEKVSIYLFGVVTSKDFLLINN